MDIARLISIRKKYFGWNKMKRLTHIETELTNCCQLHCQMCPHAIMKRTLGFMSRRVFENIIDQCRGYVKTMYLHQLGEPLLHSELTAFIDYAADAGIRTSISTNCMLLGDKIDEILDSKLAEITLCLDSTDQNIYEQIRQGSNYQKVLANILLFLAEKKKRKSKIHVQQQMIKMMKNQHEWNKFSKLDGVDELLVKNYCTFAGNIPDEMQTFSSFKCGKTSHSLTFQHNGDIVVCCRDFNGETVLGNVTKDKVSDVWAKHRNTNCKTIPFCSKCENNI